MIRAIVLSAVSLIGFVFLGYFTCRLLREIGTGKPLSGYAAKIGLPGAGIFLSLLLQRLFPLAIGFIAVMVLFFTVVYIAVKLGGKPGHQHREPVVTFRLVELGQYARHIGQRSIVRRILKLQSLVGGIRAVVGYNQRTVIDQNADILRMENIYLPRIESLINQYIKISRHDPNYDSRGLMEQLDTLTNGIQKIQSDCLTRDKMNIDAEASALISAMEMDGFVDERELHVENSTGEE
jgi:hypothetical protein